MKDYYTNHPEGIALQKIYNAAVKAIHGFIPKSFVGGVDGGQPVAKINMEIVPGKSYSLTSAFKANSINNTAKKISVSLSWSIAVDQSFDIYLCNEGAEKMEPIILCDPHDEKEKVYFDYYNQHSNIKERIFFCLDKIDTSLKYISLCSLANMRPKQKGLNKFVRKNWSNAYCMVSDAESNVELMRFNLPSHDSPCGVFIALFIRGDDGDWKFMPVCRIFESKNIYHYPPLNCADSQDAFRDFVLSGAAK